MFFQSVHERIRRRYFLFSFLVKVYRSYTHTGSRLRHVHKTFLFYSILDTYPFQRLPRENSRCFAKNVQGKCSDTAVSVHVRPYAYISRLYGYPAGGHTGNLREP